MTTEKTISKTEEELLEALRSGDVDVRRDAAENPNATPEVLLLAMGDEDVDVRLEAARNPNATPEVLLLALKDEYSFVRSAAAGNPNATPEILMVAMEDEDERVLYYAAGNPSIKSLKLSTDEWLELVAEGVFRGNLKNVPPHVKKDPRYGSIRLLSKLVQ